MNTIYINGRFLCQQITGVQRYALELVKAIDELLEENVIDANQYHFVLLAPNNIISRPKFNHITLVRSGILKGHLWEQFELPLLSRNGLLINLCNAAPIFKANQVLTIHDAAVYLKNNSYNKLYTVWYKILYAMLRRRAKKIITVSNFSKQELARYCNIDNNKINVIYEGKEHILRNNVDESILRKHDLSKNGYVFAVSSKSPNKNFRTIVQAIQELGETDFDIVIAGGTNSRIFKDEQYPISNKVKYIGYVSDEELKALYENAGCFIYPSYYEGFGLPPLEAMACGCPVIVSNAASLPEVCEEAAIYCDPHSVKDVAEKISLLMSNKQVIEQMKHKGLERASIFNWERTAKESFFVFKEVLNQ